MNDQGRARYEDELYSLDDDIALASIEQFLIDMMDRFQQSDVEGKICAAYRALKET